MLVPFLIMLREGIEAALIVGIIASYLKQTGRGQWMPAVWIGVFLAAALSLLVGGGLELMSAEFPQKQQELFEGIVGLILAIFVGFAIYSGSLRLNLSLFFRWTGLFILVVGAGILANSVQALHEAGLWNHLQGVVFDISSALPMDGPAGSVLAGMFGYQDAPTVSVLGAYVIYLLVTLAMFFRPPAPPKSVSIPSVTNP